MKLNYVVITSVDRDDLDDAGSQIFAKTISETKKLSPNIKVEVLTPDFNGISSLLKNVIKAKPDVMNHNIETVRRIFRKVRPKGDFSEKDIRYVETIYRIPKLTIYFINLTRVN